MACHRSARGFADGIEARRAGQGCPACEFADGIEARRAGQGCPACEFADGIEAAPGHPWPSRHSCILHISGAARQGWRACGFTLIELVMVIVLLGILAAVAGVRLAVSPVDVGAQAEQLAADIRYTQSLAMSRGRRFRINFTASSYQITDMNGVAQVHPATGQTAAVSLAPTSLSGYNPPLANGYLAFDSRGVPYTSPSAALASTVAITLAGGGESRTVRVAPETGHVQ